MIIRKTESVAWFRWAGGRKLKQIRTRTWWFLFIPFFLTEEVLRAVEVWRP